MCLLVVIVQKMFWTWLSSLQLLSSCRYPIVIRAPSIAADGGSLSEPLSAQNELNEKNGSLLGVTYRMKYSLMRLNEALFKIGNFIKQNC